MKGEPRSEIRLKNKEKTYRSVFHLNQRLKSDHQTRWPRPPQKHDWLSNTQHRITAIVQILYKTYTDTDKHNIYPQSLTRLGCPVRLSCGEHTRHGWNRKSHWEQTKIPYFPLVELISQKTCQGHISRPISGHNNVHKHNYACFPSKFPHRNTFSLQFSHFLPTFHISHPNGKFSFSEEILFRKGYFTMLLLKIA